jgi:hypothetical protein
MFDFFNGTGDVPTAESEPGFMDEALGAMKLALDVGEGCHYGLGLVLGAVNSKRGRVVLMDFKGLL